MRGREGMGVDEGEIGSGYAPSDERQIKRRRSLLKTPQPVVPGSHQGQGLGGGREGGVRVARQIRGAAENDGGHYSSSSSFGGDREPLRLGPVKPNRKSRSMPYIARCNNLFKILLCIYTTVRNTSYHIIEA